MQKIKVTLNGEIVDELTVVELTIPEEMLMDYLTNIGDAIGKTEEYNDMLRRVEELETGREGVHLALIEHIGSLIRLYAKITGMDRNKVIEIIKNAENKISAKGLRE